MSEKQYNERKSTRYQGVNQRLSRTRTHKGKPDVCYSIDYHDPITGKRVRQTIGWRSQGITPEYANSVRVGIMSDRQKEKFSPVVPMDAKDCPSFQQAWELYRVKHLEATEAKGLKAKTGFYKNHLDFVVVLIVIWLKR